MLIFLLWKWESRQHFSCDGLDLTAVLCKTWKEQWLLLHREQSVHWPCFSGKDKNFLLAFHIFATLIGKTPVDKTLCLWRAKWKINSSALGACVISIPEVFFEEKQSLKSWADLTVGNYGISWDIHQLVTLGTLIVAFNQKLGEEAKPKNLTIFSQVP